MLLYFLQSVICQQLPPYHQISLEYQKEGYFIADILIGNQIQKMIIDTGSHATVLDCYNRNQKQDYFILQNSTIQVKQLVIINIPCNDKCQNCDFFGYYCYFSINYADHSQIEGYYIREKILIGLQKYYNQLSTYTYIGCITKRNNFKYDVNGVLGLGPSQLDSNQYGNIIDEISRKEKTQKIFSLCLGNKMGILQIGIFDQSINDGITLKMKKIRNSYRLNLMSIQYNDLYIDTSYLQHEGGIILDSGSTYIFAPLNIYQNILKLINDDFQLIDGLPCFKKDIEQIIFNFDDALIIYYPHEFIIETKGLKCIPLMQISGEKRLIFGLWWMRNKNILFDNENNKVIIKNQKCDDIELTNFDVTGIEEDKRDLINIESKFFYVDNSLKFVLIFVFCIFLAFIYLIRRILLKQQYQNLRSQEMVEDV